MVNKQKGPRKTIQRLLVEGNEREDVSEGTEVWFHGTHAHAVPQIMQEGFKPCLGAGADHLQYHFGMAVPGVYVADNFNTASQYPIYATTGKVPVTGSLKAQDIPGGSVIAHDGTAPLRAVFRCIARKSDRLWH